MVRFMPTWTMTSLPLISMVILSLTFQPSEPVEKFLGLAVNVLSPTVILSVWACWLNSSRVIGQVVFAMMSPGSGRNGTRGGIIPLRPGPARRNPAGVRDPGLAG